MLALRRSLAIVALVALAVAFLGVMALSDGSQAQISTIVVDLEPADKTQIAYPTQTGNDILEFDGCLTLNREPFWPPGTSVVIELSIQMSGVSEVWQYSFDPPTHTFAASQSQEFSVQVTVPAGLPATTTIGQALKFTAATDDLILYNVTTDTARVSIAQYYKMTRYFSTEPLEVKQGEIIDFNFTLENAGNGVDTFSFQMTNEAELLFAGLTVTIPSPKRLEPGRTVDVNLQMQAADDAREGQFTVNLTITSDGSADDPHIDKPVKSGVEWNVVVKPSLQQTLWQNIWYILLGAGVLVVVATVLVFLRRRKRAREEEEDLEEETPPPKKKRKRRPPVVEDAEDGDLDE